MHSVRSRLMGILDRLPNSMGFCLFTVSFVAAARHPAEWLLMQGRSAVTYGGLVHHFAFYLCIFVLNVNNLSLLLGKSWKKLYGLVGTGVLLGLLPICIDVFNPSAVNRQYHYFSQFSPFFISETQLIGETITVWIWIFSVSLYVLISSSSWNKCLKGFLLTYMTVQFVGWLSYVCKDLLLEWSALKVPVDHFWALWWLIIAFSVAAIHNFREFASGIKRIQHSIIWGLLVLLGSKMIGYVNSESILRAVIMSLSFLFILLVNDYYDRDTDRVNGRESAMTEDMVMFVLYCHIILVLSAGVLDIVFGIISLLFFILSLAYNHPSVRLKKNFGTASLVEGVGAALCITAGATQFGLPLSSWYNPVLVLFGIGFAAASNLKDYKDVPGDTRCHINTLYVVLGSLGWEVRKTNRWISIILFLLLLLPCLFLILLKVELVQVLVVGVVAAVPFLLMTRVADPAAAVGLALWGINLYFAGLILVMPRLPVG